MHDYVAGVDLGGTKIYAALADLGGSVVAEEEVPTRAGGGVEKVLANIGGVLEKLSARASGRGSIRAAGVGAPGPLDPFTGVVYQAPNLGWENVSLSARLQELLGVPVAVDNDANLAALGEFTYGAGTGVKEMIYITVSTGVGGGLILDGRIYHGASGSAGEIGHMVADPSGPLCGCGRQGCLETVASGTAMARRARELAREGRGKEILRAAGGDAESISARHISTAASGGDPEALVVMEEAAGALGRAVAGVINLLNPAAVVIGGGVINAGKLFWAPMQQELNRYTLRVPGEAVRVVPAELGKRAGVIGALVLGMSAAGIRAR